MKNSEFASRKYDFRKDFDSIARPGLSRYLDTSAAVLGDAFDDERRAAYADGYTRDLWRALRAARGDGIADERRATWAAAVAAGVVTDSEAAAAIEAGEAADAECGEPWDASRAAEIAAEFEAGAIDSERRAAADPRYLRPFGGGEAYDREMAKDALCRHVMADQDRWGAEAIAAFLPIAKEARGGKDDDPSLDNHIDCLAQTFIWKFIHAKKKEAAKAKPKAAAAEPEADEPKADARAKAIWKPKAWCWQDPKTLPRLEALYGGHYYRGEVVATVAPGGVGK